MIEIIGKPRDATPEEIEKWNREHGTGNTEQERMITMTNKTCGTCIDNDCGLCDRKGILVEDSDTCEKHRESRYNWREAVMRTFLAGH